MLDFYWQSLLIISILHLKLYKFYQMSILDILEPNLPIDKNLTLLNTFFSYYYCKL